MNREQAKNIKNIITETLENSFDKSKFIYFLKNLLKSFEEKSSVYQGNHIPDAFEQYISSLERIGKYICDEKEIDLLIVQLKRETSLERARTMQRNFVAWYLKGSRGGKLKDAALVAFVSPTSEDWRFSLVKMDYRFEETPSGKVKIKEEFTPARRWSFLVGKNEKSHTARNRFIPILEDDEKRPTLEDLEQAFSVEKVTDEFFKSYRYAINEVIIKSLNKKVDHQIKHSFAQQLLSRILFIYFLQRKGWLKWKNYEQDKSYIKNLWLKYKSYNYENTFYSHWLSSLFFGAFNKKSQFINPDLPDEIRESFIQMPFLNGGLFHKNELDEIGFDVPDNVFEWLFEPNETDEDLHKGFLEVFNFTIDESSPDDVEVAVDPEMLGKVYESLINEEEQGFAGIFYTPLVEIDFMCRLSLVEYLCTRTQTSKQDLIELVFTLPAIDSYQNIENLRKIKKALDDVKIVDPAVGSASFLVGMMNILVELHSALTKRIEGKEENLFALKQKIILENLYGVDVKDWAVMVGELRLWLSLIIETDEKFMDIYTKPLLPNLTFKIRQGDSLVEAIGDVFINLRGNALKTIPKSIQQKISELIDKKAEFFSGKRSADLKEQHEIENMEAGIFKKILQVKVDELKGKLTEKNRLLKQLKGSKNLYGEEDAKSKQEQEKLSKEIEQLENELNKYQKAIDSIGQKSKKDYFLWELDFAEVFAKNGGFDIVIGNPPYVRQELIAPPLENEKDYSPEEWRELKRQYKEKLIQATQNVWQDVKRIDKKSDLYVYFYYQGLSLLTDNGIFCFINSNSWLDVGYGAGLQEFLLKNMKPIYIIDNIAKRSFKQADVNTVIVLIQKPSARTVGAQNFEPELYKPVKFIAFKKPFEEVVANGCLLMKEIENTTKPVFNNPVYRVFPKTKKELLEEGVEYPDESELELNQSPEQLPYVGNKWGGKYLRAPEIYFKILEKGKVGAKGRSPLLVRLGDIAEVRRGFTTGANEFFYLKPVGMTVKEVVKIAEKNPQALIRVKNGAGWEGEIEAEFLKPVIKSPRELKTIMVRIEDLNYLVFMCHKSKKELKGTKALEYIEWGEKQKFNQRPTCRSRSLWWDLGELYFLIISKRFVDESFSYFYNQNNFFVGDTFFIINTINPYDVLITLNSIIGSLFTEIIGRKNMGEGVLLIYGPEIYNILTIKKLDTTDELKQKVFFSIINKNVSSIFNEISIDKNHPIREQEPNPLPDRKELDDIVFDALGLTEEERKEVYWAVAELVKARLDKAKSV